MTTPGFLLLLLLLLVAACIRQSSSSAGYVDGADDNTSNAKSMPRRKYDPDQLLLSLPITVAVSAGNREKTDDSIVEDERDLSAETDCGPNRAYFRLDLRTDGYGFETSWMLARVQDDALVKIASGPPSGTSYRDDAEYVRGYCLSAGTYRFTINDKFRDGMNGGGGGSYTGYVGGMMRFGSPTVESAWSRRVHEFAVTATTSDGGTIVPEETKIYMTDTDVQWLQSHNTRRKEWHTRYGRTYVPLEWSNALKAQARAYARELLYNCGAEPVHDDTAYGENLDSNYGTGSWAELRLAEKILVRWVDGETEDDWPDNAHLTQALWRATEYVGCDVASKSFSGGMCHVYVCR